MTGGYDLPPDFGTSDMQNVMYNVTSVYQYSNLPSF